MIKYIYYSWSIFFLSLSFFFFFFFLYVTMNFYVIFIEYTLFNYNSLNLSYLIYLDMISLLFISVVMFISSLVIIYSYNYMGHMSYSFYRFFFILLIFIISMILMVISPNLISIMLGWDGLGLVSYCLVIYYTSVKSYLSGMITCLTNRIGDFGLLVCSCWLISYGSWHFLFYLDFYNFNIFILLVVSSFTKSAQVPFSSWLPMAMSAPTPISSLVHSSTLVTAGVYLLIRFYSNLFLFNSFFVMLSIMTILFSSFCSIYEFDLKSIIALSTLSQLGLMMFSIFMGFSDFSFFHLISHAMFKSLMFLCSGIFIYYMNDNQDIRYIGSVSLLMPFSSSCFNISNICLCGIPFLSGFFSSDLIFESFSFNSYSLFLYIMFYISVGMTCFYSIRLFYYCFFSSFNMGCYICFYDYYNLMSVSVFFLSFMSIFFGGFIFWFFDLNLYFLYFPFLMKLMTLIFILMGFFFGYEFCLMKFYFFNIIFYYNFGLMINMSSYLWFFYYYFYFFFYNCSHSLLCWGDYYGFVGLSYLISNLNYFFYLFSMNSFNLYIFICVFFFFFFF
uniref:NADH dehydrogenase subunit 5 n=1 Tax=Batracomorphus lineatus TaxID=3045905 RepID=UPI00257C40E5|nr:NADH dehydrogenase subunit 5 [Batracomorphus lineatus]WHE42645.1 NADH dehydrogenase subunit 5 [Batracomorphus lineatus]